MINSNAFDYINVIDKAADAAWTRNEVLANNIANVDTPNYKRMDVDFESTLQKELGKSRYRSMDAKVGDLKTSHLKAKTYVDSENFSYRLDGNNVDVETETVALAANQLKYQGLVASATAEFQNLTTVMK